jgi:hypothetical protein
VKYAPYAVELLPDSPLQQQAELTAPQADARPSVRISLKYVSCGHFSLYEMEGPTFGRLLSAARVSGTHANQIKLQLAQASNRTELQPLQNEQFD